MTQYVPPEIIDEIRTRADIVEIISEYVSLKKQGKNYVGLCPFHLEETPSFTVSPDKQIFYCFGCLKGGNVINFIMEQDNLTLPEAAEKLAEKVGVVIPAAHLTEKQLQQQSLKRRLYEMHEIAADFFHINLIKLPAGKKARSYLERREITRDMIFEFQLGYARESWNDLKNHLLEKGFSEPDMEKAGLVVKSSKGTYYDKFRDRLMFPIWDYRGKLIAFGGRVMGNELPKYLNSPETLIFNKSQMLYGINLAASFIRQHDETVIMEGYMDVIAAHQFGIKNAVASLGTSFTPDQGKLLKRYSSNVLISYDADTAGAKATNRGLEILQHLGFRVRVLNLPNGLDPDEFLHRYNETAWAHMVQNKSLSLLEYKLQAAISRHNIKSIEGKADIVQELLPEIAKIRSQVEKEQFIKLVAEQLEISEEAIYADLRKLGGSLSGWDNFSDQKHTNNTRLPGKKMTLNPKKDAGTLAAWNLCKLMMENREIFEQVEKTLGLNFTDNEVLGKILILIKENELDFDWQPATLIARTDDNVIKQVISKLSLVEIPGDNQGLLVQDYMKTIKMHQLKSRIRELEAVIRDQDKKRNTHDTIQLLQEFTKLQQQVQQLKQ